MSRTAKENDSTRNKLLEAAEKLFAAKGYSAVSIREITNAAGVHLAAVNYHFGTKRNLYHEVFRSLWIPRAWRLWEPIFEMEGRPDLSPEELLRKLALSFIEPPLSMEERYRHGMLVIQEMLRPGEVLDFLETELFIPALGHFSKLLNRVLGGGMDEQARMLGSLSILALLRHFSFDRSFLSRAFGRTYEDGLAEEIVEFMIHFILYGLKGGKSSRL